MIVTLIIIIIIIIILYHVFNISVKMLWFYTGCNNSRISSSIVAVVVVVVAASAAATEVAIVIIVAVVVGFIVGVIVAINDFIISYECNAYIPIVAFLRERTVQQKVNEVIFS